MADDDMKGPGFDPIADEYKTYEDYLDNQITATDMFYLEDVELARHLVELGIRGNGEVIRRDEFEQRKEAAEQARQARLNKKPKKLASQGKNVEEFPLLQALKDREEAVRNGKLTTIIFIRDVNSKKQEVSGYIDFGYRLKTENMEPYFDRKKRLMPRPTDLSFYNWETQTSTSNPTPNFQVIADNEAGLLFKNKRDRKVINVDPRLKPGDNSTRTELTTPEFLQVVIYDHVTRRRS
uniref:Cilia- and flagella-associated protein 299 n=1 Tax=Dunaliella tertiolecta TaxID=3047 RepID=A0A7S3VPZ8_DUNTE|mmetsp:Transcript_14632/g.39586  ORF Transcript_14632/g.39586 Transcript_14632/m.39586 type:complete len:237 (+) Transcript_14632:113-823(+)|eukprot:CAMPEP_0202350080 /NCGR_PEP_ID=MMETSP1126-20121109/7295_1 /ASSEMBLY_ACC=CAM_ASM_000457 /TAXON_ID=3047 /ORGANISM="Dunaliella tertiolecta, Strain CCMP1320" /LENGTH=236 /DNA_ID=CAMNT_0048941979 /DNA_START=90 /DNA_END=800 /DNA_ORIENTATION=-